MVTCAGVICQGSVAPAVGHVQVPVRAHHRRNSHKANFDRVPRWDLATAGGGIHVSHERDTYSGRMPQPGTRARRHRQRGRTSLSVACRIAPAGQFRGSGRNVKGDEGPRIFREANPWPWPPRVKRLCRSASIRSRSSGEITSRGETIAPGRWREIGACGR